MISEVLSWLNFSVLPSIDFKGLNKKGHRRCIAAKKELFELAAKMHFELKLPMTDFSLFFRGVNYEIKRVNTFGLGNAELASYLELRDKDQNVEQTRQKIRVNLEAQKAMGDAHEDPQSEQGANLDETFVDSMCKQRVQMELEQENRLPKLDLDMLCMGQKQLFDQQDLPRNLDTSDLHTAKGQSTVYAEIMGI